MLPVSLFLVLLLSVLAVPHLDALAAKFRPVSNADTEVVTFPVLLSRVAMVDPTTRTVLLVTTTGDALRVPADSLGFRFDPDEPRGRAELHFFVRTTLHEERERVRAWDWKHARNGRYRPGPGMPSRRPTVSCTLVFRSEPDYREYLEGFVSPLPGGTVVRY